MRSTNTALTPKARPRHSALTPQIARRLAATEYQRVAAALALLSSDDWAKPTSCPEWDVRQLACHLVGMAMMPTTPFEMARQSRAAGRIHSTRGGPMVDSVTQLQVDERADWTPAQLVAAARAVGARAVRGRAFFAAVAGQSAAPGTQLVNGVDERWTIGFLMRTILTRDPWMHRSDLAVATGRPMELTAEHDGMIVADVVAEWAGRHGAAYRLELTGPAGGSWSAGDVGPGDMITMDAVEFCRILSGRGSGPGLLAVAVPF